ncbi:MAG: biopolymer transporter ExbD [Planctomycetia bacterium]|nr:biopolymer transporter ExbD [Planctomycetia bacterium]
MSPARKHNRRGMHDARHVGPNMTPMVDVVMVILIFFMLGSSFVSPDWYLTNNTPAIKGGLSNVKTHAMPPTRINIKLRVRGTRTVAIMPGLQTADLSGELATFLTAKHKALARGVPVQVFISPSNGVPYKDVITAYSDCIQARFRQVAFRPPPRH